MKIGQTALIYAAKFGFLNVVNALIENNDTNGNIKDNGGIKMYY